MEAHGRPGVRHYVLCYALFLVVLALCLLAFVVWRQAIFDLLGATYGSGYDIGKAYTDATIEQVASLLIGLILFIVVVASEPYLRGGLTLHRHLDLRQELRRFTRLALPLAVAIVVGIALQVVSLTLL